jgi:hypothetical protein
MSAIGIFRQQFSESFWANAVSALRTKCGITGALIGMGIPEFEAKRYEGHLRKGGSSSPYISTRLSKSSVPRKF